MNLERLNSARRARLNIAAIIFIFLAAFLNLEPPAARAATGCAYPTTLDSFVDKIAGDFLTIADVNTFRCAIEKLETGPLRPNDGSAAAPAFTFRGNADLGLFRQGADAMGFSAAGAEVARLTSTGIAPAGSGLITANRTSCTATQALLGTGTCVEGQPGLFGSVGQLSLNNAGTPNTQFDLVATAVMLRDATNNVVIRFNPGSITNNVSTTGPAANGRDQSGAFSASSWIHFYWIWNPTTSTLATVSSAVAPPTGPTLPTDYTHWAYAGAVRFNGSSQLVKTRLIGSHAFYEVRQSALSAGAATTETSVDVATLVPPNALAMQLALSVINPSSGANNMTIRFVTGSDFYVLNATLNNSSVQRDTTSLAVPNVGQAFFYLTSNASGTADAWVTGYTMPNGGA